MTVDRIGPSTIAAGTLRPNQTPEKTDRRLERTEPGGSPRRTDLFTQQALLHLNQHERQFFENLFPSGLAQNDRSTYRSDGQSAPAQIRLDHELVVRQIREAVRRVSGVDRIKVRVNPADEEMVRKRRDELVASSDAIRELLIETDATISPGGCILESEHGNVDARIETQLERLEAALLNEP